MTFFKWFASPRQLRHAGVLSMNCRNHEIIARLNKRRLYPLVDDKSQTKTLAAEFGIQTPHLIGTIDAQHEVKDFLKIIGSRQDFVVKPAHGSGG